MATTRWIVLLLAAAMITLLAGCGGSTANVQNPPPPPPSQITVAFQPEPEPTIAVGFSESLTAVVTNDPSNDGVDWSLSCQGGAGTCGTLTVNGNTATHTASGSPITYTAPSSLSGNSAVVEIVALATADQNKNVVAPVTVSAFSSGLKAGNYVFQAQGSQNGPPYQIAGVIALDGQGNITGGEQTVNTNGVSITDSVVVSGSGYFIGNDGRGTITINTNDNNIGGNGIETFSLVFLNNSGSPNPEALIAQIDFAGAGTGASASGTLDLQQPGVTTLSGSYAFVMNGTNVVDGLPMALGGVFDIQAQNAITGIVDEVLGEKVKLSDAALLAGSQVSAPDTFGQLKLTLVGLSDGIHTKAVTAVLTGYLVDAMHLKLIETDATAASLTPLGLTGGMAIGQVSGSYGNFTDASFSGPFAYGVTGVDLAQGNLTPTTWTLAGVVTADGQSDGALTSGYLDSFLQVNCVQATCKTGALITGAQISSAFTGTYAVDSASDSCGATSGSVVAGTGRSCLTPTTFATAPNPTYNPELLFYLTGQTDAGQPAALVLGVGDIGGSPSLHYPSLGTGIAYVQSGAAATFSGTYGMSFTQQSGTENDGTAQMTVAPSGTPQITGVADSTLTTPDDTAVADHLFAGSVSVPQTANAFAGSLFDAEGNGGPFNPNPSSASNGITVDYFFIDTEHGFFVETDLITPSPGSTQVGFGYYAARTPVCQGCQ